MNKMPSDCADCGNYDKSGPKTFVLNVTTQVDVHSENQCCTANFAVQHLVFAVDLCMGIQNLQLKANEFSQKRANLSRCLRR